VVTELLAPSCPRCHKRHLLDLACWSGRYAQRVTAVVLAEQGRVCWLCGTGGADSADHVVPRSRCGTDAQSNLRPSCRRCNSSRQNRAPFRPDPEPRPAGVGLSPRWRTP
jgi:5-methylcytosine-specific restriction endonuclease McrA